MNLQDCLPATPPIYGRPPEFPLTDLGPEWIDSDTVRGMAEQIQRGTVQFAYDPSDLVDSTEKSVLEALFVTYLHESPLSSPHALAHRVLALVRAIKHMIEAADTPAPVMVLDSHTVMLGATTLALWLNDASAALPARFTDAQRAILRDEVMLITVKEVTQLTGIGAASLQQYRDRGIGPQYVRMSRNNTGIRYPVVALLGWLYGYQGGADNG